MPFRPKQQTLTIGEHRKVTSVSGDFGEQLTHQRHGNCQRMAAQTLPRLFLAEHARRRPLAINTGLNTALPRAHDHLPQHRWRPPPRMRYLMRGPQKAGPGDLVRGKIDTNPRAVHSLSPLRLEEAYSSR